jgi:hypothetical protein
MDKESLKEYILCEYNRDADSYRSEIHDFPHDYIYIVFVFLFSISIGRLGALVSLDYLYFVAHTIQSHCSS